ncbi:MAG TPA: RNA polymerase sigma factor [Candidatus Binataceae bacterium]|nr:RNA polymerase sigma factor [Candidatus Binataceae bacterium]
MPTPEQLVLPPPFEDAMKSLEREIMRFILRTTRDREDSLDLFQETWLRAYRAYPSLRSGSALRPWVFSIAANLCRNRARDRMRRVRVIANDGRDPAAEAERLRSDPNGSLEGALGIKRALAKLPGKQGQALIMRKFGGMEYAEIAARLECSPESARAGVHQALKKLKVSQ